MMQITPAYKIGNAIELPVNRDGVSPGKITGFSEIPSKGLGTLYQVGNDLWSGPSLRFGEALAKEPYRPKSMPSEADQRALEDKVRTLLKGLNIPGNPQFSRWHDHAIVIFMPENTPGAVDPLDKKNKKYGGPYPDLQGRLDKAREIHWDKQKKSLYYQEKRGAQFPKTPIFFATETPHDRRRFEMFQKQIPPSEQHLLAQDFQRLMTEHGVPGSVQYSILLGPGLVIFYEPFLKEEQILQGLKAIPGVHQKPSQSYSPIQPASMWYLDEFPIQLMANMPMELIRPV